MSVPSLGPVLNKLVAGQPLNRGEKKLALNVAKVALGTIAVVAATIAASQGLALVIGLSALGYLGFEMANFMNPGLAGAAGINSTWVALNAGNTPVLRAYYIIAKDIQRVIQG